MMGVFRKFLRYVLHGRARQTKEMNADDTLEQSVRNAALVVMTASENTLSLDTESISVIVAAKKAFATESVISEELETRFWIAYQSVTEAIKPATVDSIKATYEPSPTYSKGFLSRKNTPLSRKCASNYKFISILTLTFLIAIQIYWYIGWSIMEDIDAQTRAIDDLNTELTTISLQESNPDSSAARLKQANLATLKDRIVVHTEWRDAAYHHLKNWNQTWSSLDLITLQPWQEDDFAAYPILVQRHIEFVAAGNFLAAVMSYILPILYGMIGACFFILRQLPREIGARTFSMNSYIGYSLRMAQGPLAGILVSYFFTSDQSEAQTHAVANSDLSPLDPTFASLSPLAIAFLAGYSVEFIFKIIDKALVSPKPEEPSPTMATQPRSAINKLKEKSSPGDLKDESS
ncbi:MAG: hypothetical protein ABJN40_14115 [Sneathiella sp.]